MSEFKLPDPKKTSGKVLGLGLLGGFGLIIWSYVLPFLNTVVWGTIELAIGAAVLGVLGYILTNKNFWKRLQIILDTFGEILFKGFIEMNPFTIMEMQLDRTERDREDLRLHAEKLKGQEDKLKTSLDEENRNLKVAAEKMEICKQKMRSSTEVDDEVSFALDAASNDFVNSKDYIEKVSPVYGDIKRLVTLVDRAYRKSEYALKNARNTVAKQRATYEAVTTGSNAMKKALRAFTGDPEMNKAGAIALEKLRTDIAAKVGAIKNSIQITSRIMNERDLEDAAKINMAANEVEQLNMDATFDYIAHTEVVGRIPQTVSVENKWLNNLK